MLCFYVSFNSDRLECSVWLVAVLLLFQEFFPLEMLKKLNTRLSFTQRSVNSFGLIINEIKSTCIICKIQPSKKESVVVRDRPQQYWCILVSFGTGPSPMPVLNFVAQSLPRHRENNAIQGSESNVASEVCHRFPEVCVYQCWHSQVSIWMCLSVSLFLF